MARDNLHASLLREYGAILDASVTAKLAGYHSVEALRQARFRGHLPFRMFQLPHRRGWFTSVDDIATCLESQMSQAS